MVGFEPTDLVKSLVFKTNAISQTLPHFRIHKHTGPYRSGQWIRVSAYAPAAFVIRCVYEYPVLLLDMSGLIPRPGVYCSTNGTPCILSARLGMFRVRPGPRFPTLHILLSIDLFAFLNLGSHTHTLGTL